VASGTVVFDGGGDASLMPLLGATGSRRAKPDGLAARGLSSGAMTEIARLREQPPLDLAPGVRAYALFGQGAMLNLVDLEPDGVVPLHQHPHEQLGIVLSGTITMTIDGTDHVLAVDDAYAILGDVPHAARAGPEGCTVLDVFHPVREEYRR
jgi:quercetin dioxygenase-like cupin family protein